MDKNGWERKLRAGKKTLPLPGYPFSAAVETP